MNFDIRWWCVVTVWWVGGAAGEGWRWPAGAESLRIDTKVRFLDSDGVKAQNVVDSKIDITSKKSDVSHDETPFQPALDTSGFYNRAGNEGRFPMRVLLGDKANYRIDNRGVYPVHNNNQSDELQFCKCVSTPDCTPRYDSNAICGSGKFLCCYKRPNIQSQRNTEFFNEIDDERPMLFPGHEHSGGAFPPPPGSDFNGFGPGHGHSVVLGAVDIHRNYQDRENAKQQPGVLEPRPVLSGPDGPTGIIGPAPVESNAHASASAQYGILTGPGGPTGRIGPYNPRPVLVGPGGPSGVIGPGRGGSRGILVGPGGPTGVIGPGGYARQQGPGLLVGPGGPTGIIGPGRQLLVGPGGPTGIIGPRRFFGN